MAEKIEFVRGDGVDNTKEFFIPAASWSAGGKLFFAAKPAIDDDNTDAAAVINRSWDDGAASDETIGGVAYKKYTCDFPPSVTNSIPSEGAESREFLGEFQWVSSGGDPITFPPKKKLQCIVYFDVKRGVV